MSDGPTIIPVQTAPEQEPIWRYMDLQRFVTMLVSGAIRFARASTFQDDPWEGFCKAFVPGTPIPEVGGDGTTQLESNAQLGAALARYSAGYLGNAHEHLYVSSWSLESDSMAMWKIYGAKGRGLAIRSSVKLYKEALQFPQSEDHYRHGCVEYADDIANSPQVVADFTENVLIGPELWQFILSKAFFKRSAYQFEKEWRSALYRDPLPKDVTGVDIPCRLDTLINRVIVGPNSAPYLVGVIEDLLEKFGIQKTVEASSLLRPPPIQRIFTSSEFTANQV